MGKCPKCDKEIDCFKVWEKTDTRSFYELEDDELVPVETIDTLYNGEGFEFQCPECIGVLFRDYDNALKFLKGEADVTFTVCDGDKQ